MNGDEPMKWESTYLDWIMAKADQSFKAPISHITDKIAPLSPGDSHDYYSNGDYWWPNPNTPTGLPYIRRDGQSNPEAFLEHRQILRQMRSHVANLAAGYLITQDELYAHRATLWLQEFFLDEKTKMRPHLIYAQAIPGVCDGRGIGIIDTLHLIDVPVAIQTLKTASCMPPELYMRLQQWFANYLSWMTTHPYGLEEREAKNNHGVCWHVQAGIFARFTNNEQIIKSLIQRYKQVYLPEQMDLDGSFPAELQRTKPYGYSIFQLDNMINLCQILSTPEENLWEFQLPDGRSIQRALEFLYPYMLDKTQWPYDPDVQSYDNWPVAVTGLLFAGIACKQPKYIQLWKELTKDPKDPEVRRNMAIRQPILWLRK